MACRCGKELGILPHYYFPCMDLRNIPYDGSVARNLGKRLESKMQDVIKKTSLDSIKVKAL